MLARMRPRHLSPDRVRDVLLRTGKAGWLELLGIRARLVLALGLAACAPKVRATASQPPTQADVAVSEHEGAGPSSDGGPTPGQCQCGSAEARAAQYFDIALFGAGRDVVATQSPLAPGELDELGKLIPSLTRNFAGYLPSGCHNRAHALFLLLPERFRIKAMKIWLMSPGVYTPGFFGLIDLDAAKWPQPDVNWGFHVALAFRRDDGELVIADAGLRPDHLLSEAEWFAQMEVPPLSIWTLTTGDVAQFTAWNVDPDNKLKPVNRFVWAGRFLREQPGKGVDLELLAKELARDWLGADVLAGETCSALAEIASGPTGAADLQAALEGPVKPGCEAEFLKFEEQRIRLLKLLFDARTGAASGGRSKS